jgi:hypothetical protein
MHCFIALSCKANRKFRDIDSVIIDGDRTSGAAGQRFLESFEIKTLPASGVKNTENAFLLRLLERTGNRFIDSVGHPVVVTTVQKPSSALDHVCAVTRFFGMLLMSKQEIDVSLTCSIKGVFPGALIAAG